MGCDRETSSNVCFRGRFEWGEDGRRSERITTIGRGRQGRSRSMISYPSTNECILKYDLNFFFLTVKFIWDFHVDRTVDPRPSTLPFSVIQQSSSSSSTCLGSVADPNRSVWSGCYRSQCRMNWTGGGFLPWTASFRTRKPFSSQDSSTEANRILSQINDSSCTCTHPHLKSSHFFKQEGEIRLQQHAMFHIPNNRECWISEDGRGRLVWICWSPSFHDCSGHELPAPSPSPPPRSRNRWLRTLPLQPCVTLLVFRDCAISWSAYISPRMSSQPRLTLPGDSPPVSSCYRPRCLPSTTQTNDCPPP